MKPCGKPIGNFSRHAPSKVDRILQMKTEVEENCMRACIFRIHGLLDEIYGYDGVTRYLLEPRESLEWKTAWQVIEEGGAERILSMVERLAKVASPF